MVSKKQKLAIIDGNALIHRAFHALPPLATKKGELVNAIYGFITILFKTIKDIKPTHLVVTFDLKGPTFRHEEFKEYKAQRKKQPDELYEQIPKTKEIVEAFNIPVYQKQGFEADDLIATIRDKIEKVDKEIEIYVVTGDLDTLQLIDDQTRVYTLRKGVKDTMIYGEKEVKDRYGFGPMATIEFKALRGDPSDNIPGVKGIGEISAINLVKKYKTLDNVYKNLDKIKPERVKKALTENKKEALLSRKLVILKHDVQIAFDFEKCLLTEYDRDKVVDLFQKYEFKRLLTQLSGLDLLKSNTGPQKMDLFDDNSPSSPTRAKKSDQKYQLIDSKNKFDKFLTQLNKQKEFSFDTETTGLNWMEDKLLGVSFSWKPGEAYYVIADFTNQLKPVLENKQAIKIAQNLKFDLEVLGSHGVEVADNYFDTMLASYLLDPGSRGHSLDKLAFSEFGYEMMPITDLIGPNGKNQITLEQVDIKKVSWYSCEDADMTFQLYLKLGNELRDKSIEGLFKEIEMPLIPVLIELERNGVKLDVNFLKKQSKSVKAKVAKISKEIYEHSGKEFNISSPIQLKEILFDELAIPTDEIRVGKTGLSTGAAELEKIKDNHPIVPLIMEYRELTKLDSTYLAALPKLVSKKDNRLHTSFNQTITATGRLSSSEPNLQNIPTRTKLGKEVRKAFIAEPGCQILNADYNQIELRIVASLADDKKMLEAFKKGEDIHSRTAAEIHGIDIDEVTPEIRRTAKSINFGIIYGMGVFGLSLDAGISREEAKEFMDKYFDLHKNIAKYMEASKQMARTQGYVETLFGRRRYLPEINSGVMQIKRAAERMAINAPVQGTAADLMKIAMIKVSNEMKKKFKPEDYKLILQVHDSLVLEVKKSKMKQVAKVVRDVMDNVYELKAPITVDIEIGDNWGEMKKLDIH